MNRTTCTCGARYEAFRAVDDEGHALTYGSVQAMLRVGSDDPELWRAKGRAAVLRLWGQLKRAQWDVTHGYCAGFVVEHEAPTDPEDARAEIGDASFDVAAFDNAVTFPIKDDRCDCDHCNPSRWMPAALVQAIDRATRKAPKMKTRTISVRRTVAAYTASKRPGPVPCAVAGCTHEGKAFDCPADGASHGHGRIHYSDCHSDLVFKPNTWLLICDEHYRICADARRAWEARGVIACIGCTCKGCAAHRLARGLDHCAGDQNGMGPCSIDQASRGVACETCQGEFNRIRESLKLSKGRKGGAA